MSRQTKRAYIRLCPEKRKKFQAVNGKRIVSNINIHNYIPCMFDHFSSVIR